MSVRKLPVSCPTQQTITIPRKTQRTQRKKSFAFFALINHFVGRHPGSLRTDTEVRTYIIIPTLRLMRRPPLLGFLSPGDGGTEGGVTGVGLPLEVQINIYACLERIAELGEGVLRACGCAFHGEGIVLRIGEVASPNVHA